MDTHRAGLSDKQTLKKTCALRTYDVSAFIDRWGNTKMTNSEKSFGQIGKHSLKIASKNPSILIVEYCFQVV